MNVNKLFFAGNLTRDPELKFLPDGTGVCEFGVAVNRKWKDKEEATYVDFTAWGKAASTIAENFTKGSPIFIEGRLKFEQWNDSQGNKRSKLKGVVETWQFVGPKGQPKAEGQPATQEKPAPQKIPNDQIPF